MRTRHTTIEGGRERAAHNRVPQAKDVPDKELITERDSAVMRVTQRGERGRHFPVLTMGAACPSI